MLTGIGWISVSTKRRMRELKIGADSNVQADCLAPKNDLRNGMARI